MDDYASEGRRTGRWFVDGVVKYHRMLETYLNTLIASGLTIAAVTEPRAGAEVVRARPEFAVEGRRPPFLFVKSQRPSGPSA